MRQTARHWPGGPGQGRRRPAGATPVWCRRLLPGLSVLVALGPALATQRHSIDPATGIETWAASVAGVSVSLTQILPDQLRAFYVNRGFSSAAIEPYARSCVYMTVLRNDAAEGVVQFRLADWRVVAGTGVRPVVATGEWVERLQAARPTAAAMIAFRWAQFPSAHAYQPGGDWNQGMLSIGLRPGEVFDLVVRLEVEGRSYTGELEDVRCAREAP